jgi:predicted RNase H-like HicB family nuclease
MNPFVYAWQGFLYGVLKQRPDIDLSDLPLQIRIISHYDKASQLHWVEAPDHPDFMATGRTSEELAKNIGDTLLVYFDIPSYFARKYTDGTLIVTNHKTGEQETISINKEALEKVLA